MRIRQIAPALAVIAVLGLSACSTEQTGNAVAASGAVAQAAPASVDSSVGESPEPTETSEPVERSGIADYSVPDPTSSPTPPSPPAPTEEPGAPSSAETSVPSTSADTDTGTAATTAVADKWPTDLCELMPGNLTKGLEKQDGDPQLRCMYAGTIDHKYSSVIISKGSFSIDPEDPAGNNSGQAVKTGTVDGRKAWSWLVKSVSDTNAATVAFNSGERGAAYSSISNEAKDPEQNRQAALALAAQVSKALKGGQPDGGAVTAPPSTSYPKVPAGTRAWPHVICDLAPEKLLADMEKARGFETQSCRLSADTDNGFVKIEISQAVPPRDPADPAKNMGTDQKKETFDGRTVYSYLGERFSSNSVPSAYVTFDTGGRKWLMVRISEADVVKAVAPEKVRADALALAKQIAPKLPKP